MLKCHYSLIKPSKLSRFWFITVPIIMTSETSLLKTPLFYECNISVFRQTIADYAAEAAETTEAERLGQQW